MMSMLAATALAELVRTPLEEVFGFWVAAGLSSVVFAVLSYGLRRWLLALRG